MVSPSGETSTALVDPQARPSGSGAQIPPTVRYGLGAWFCADTVSTAHVNTRIRPHSTETTRPALNMAALLKLKHLEPECITGRQQQPLTLHCEPGLVC